MDFGTEMNKVLKEGEMLLGEKTVKKALLKGELKMVIVSANMAETSKEDLKRYAGLSKIKYYEYPESSKELGYACGKPFTASVVGIVKDGGSKILQLK